MTECQHDYDIAQGLPLAYKVCRTLAAVVIDPQYDGMCSAGMGAYLTNGQEPSITIMPSKFTLHNHHKLCPLILLCFSNWHLV